MQRRDPDPAAREKTALLQFLEHQRETILVKASGLGRVDLARTTACSSLTLAGLLKHLALVEDDWIQTKFLGLPEREPWASAPWHDDPDWEFHTAVDDNPDDLRELYRTACQRNTAVMQQTALDALAVGRDRAGDHWNLRWVILHLIEETARHVGHADILRESIDGTVGD